MGIAAVEDTLPPCLNRYDRALALCRPQYAPVLLVHCWWGDRTRQSNSISIADLQSPDLQRTSPVSNVTHAFAQPHLQDRRFRANKRHITGNNILPDGGGDVLIVVIVGRWCLSIWRVGETDQHEAMAWRRLGYFSRLPSAASGGRFHAQRIAVPSCTRSA